MNSNSQKQQEQTNSDMDKPREVAIPYIPPPPPDSSSQKKFNSPAVNTVLLVGVILLGGFMIYNFIGNKLTRISASSIVVTAIPTVSVTPTPTP